MADRPTQVPEWATGEGADIVEPPAGKKEQGWVQGEKPPAGFFNWLFGLLGEWVAWFAERVGDDERGGIRVAGLLSDARGVRSFVAREDGLAGWFQAEGDRARAIQASSEEDIAVVAVGKLGGEFVGDGGLMAEALADKPAVAAVVEEGSGGIPLDLRPDSDVNPERGALRVGPQSGVPASPELGEVYLSPGGAQLAYWDGAAWVPLALSSETTKRIVVGDQGAPPLTAGWLVSPAPLYDPSFYFDGRRVWLDGYLEKPTGISSVMFTLPAGRRPASDVVFGSGPLVDSPDPLFRLEVHANGEVVIPGADNEHVIVSLAGLSFEVAP